MPPNMDEGLLQSHPLPVPSPSEPSNEEPVFDRAAVHREDFQGGPFPKQNFQVSHRSLYHL